MAVRLADGAASACLPARDDALQAERRLDWRFLLPDPRLGRVLYLGPGKDRLLSALRERSASVATVGVVAGVQQPWLRDRAIDGVVVQSPTASALGYAATRLRAGGWLYVEVTSRSGWRRGEECGVSRVRALLHDLGFAAPEIYALFPDFERCTGIMPLGDRTAAAYFAARSGRRMAVPLAATLRSWMLRPAAAARLFPCLGVVARKEATS